MAKSLRDNSPNARKLLDSLRYLGYDSLYAISDLVDNCVDAGAENVWIVIKRSESGELIIQIADDGEGMTEAVLDQATRLGSETDRDIGTDLGRFGMGLVTATLSLGLRLRIVTRTGRGKLLANVTDFEEMIKANKFEKEYFGPARKREADLFRELLDGASSGTVVQISKTEGFKRQYIGAFETALDRHLGQVYRMFLRTGRKLFVNGRPVEAHDPLWLDDPNTKVWSDTTHDLKFFDASGDEVREPVRVRLVILPDHGTTALNKRAGYRIERSGFYVMRNNREIAPAQLLGLASISRHPDFIRFRGEIFIPGKLDEPFGIELTKRDVKPIQSIRDQLDLLVGPELKSIRADLRRKAVKEESKSLDHTPAERLIESKGALLIKPRVRQGAGPKGGKQPDEEPGRTKLGLVKFRIGHFGREGPIYATEQQGKTTFVDWNADHPFYEVFLLARRNDQDALTAADALVYCMATAELRVFDEDSQSFVESWKTVFSSNLRTLLG